jgi:hypothetical protein
MFFRKFKLFSWNEIALLTGQRRSKPSPPQEEKVPEGRMRRPINLAVVLKNELANRFPGAPPLPDPLLLCRRSSLTRR